LISQQTRSNWSRRASSTSLSCINNRLLPTGAQHSSSSCSYTDYSDEELDNDSPDIIDEEDLLIDVVPANGLPATTSPTPSPSTGPHINDIFAHQGAERAALCALSKSVLLAAIWPVVGSRCQQLYSSGNLGMKMVSAVQHTIRMLTVEETSALLTRTHKKARLR
jgi:hypothetical protein